MTGPAARRLPDGRLHLWHGPIDLVISAEGEGRNAAFAAARVRFDTVLTGLVAELPLLRARISDTVPDGPIARRMHAAARPHAANFVTPMAAVAGAVADAVLASMLAAAPNLTRAHVNNGGDIAFHLAPGQTTTAALAGLDGSDQGRALIRAGDPVRGIATSGRGGRSHSLGIADSVTVLARTAAEADVAATLIANAVDLPGHPAIIRTPANTLAPDSDLGTRPVTTHLGPLTPGEIARALDAGLTAARAMARASLIEAATLRLADQTRTLSPAPTESLTHA